MKLVVISHKPCWPGSDSPSGYATDGGFPIQIAALSELFDETVLVVPVQSSPAPTGIMSLIGHNLRIRPLSAPAGTGVWRRLLFVFWLLRNGLIILKQVLWADAVHTPIPGDIGTIGMLIAFVARKPLFVRHCGNWENQRTTAEKFWRWFMERFAGGRNVFLATGGAVEPPSEKNTNIKWIFSTSLTQAEIFELAPSSRKEISGTPRLITVGRVERGKNVHLLIESLSYLQNELPGCTLEVLGDGNEMGELKKLTNSLGLSNSVQFLGRVEHETVLQRLKSADFFCFPTNSEGFPKAVLEALACGLPVITTRVSVLPMLVETNQCGVALSGPSPKAIANAVYEIASKPHLYQSMSLRAVQTANQYSLETWQATIQTLLEHQWGKKLNGTG